MVRVLDWWTGLLKEGKQRNNLAIRPHGRLQ